MDIWTHGRLEHDATISRTPVCFPSSKLFAWLSCWLLDALSVLFLALLVLFVELPLCSWISTITLESNKILPLKKKEAFSGNSAQAMGTAEHVAVSIFCMWRCDSWKVTPHQPAPPSSILTRKKEII